MALLMRQLHDLTSVMNNIITCSRIYIISKCISAIEVGWYKASHEACCLF